MTSSDEEPAPIADDKEKSDEEEKQEEEVADPWESNPSWKTRTNSPMKRASKSAVWDSTKRLALDHPKIDDGYTHTCHH